MSEHVHRDEGVWVQRGTSNQQRDDGVGVKRQVLNDLRPAIGSNP